MSKRILLVVALVVALTAVAGAQRVTIPEDLAGKMKSAGLQIIEDEVEAPAFTVSNLDGGQISLSSFRGKVLFLNFWATWCPPCRKEMPSMERLYQTLKGEEFEILAVDLREKPEDVKSFVSDGGYTYPIGIDSKGSVGGMYGVRSIPTSYLIGPNGYVIAGTVGGREWDSKEIVKIIRSLSRL
ncbi:MAG: TlpA family protein disulfide reductase [Spirochaetales bacterium]|nr:TlpA family protein disulfide reductase [Spirochaetales bacterium]MCF7937093.1 TlpA family protein disulfide reductase [Spirochaetales bacterium]